VTDEPKEPSEQDDVSCHLQDIGMGTLICRAAKQKGEHSTNDVSAAICFECPVGKVYREVGCDAITPDIRIWAHDTYHINSLFCKIRRRNTSLEYCKTCGLPVADTTRQIVSAARGLFEKYGFYSAYQDLEKARLAIRDGNFENAVTRSISCLESTMRICHDELAKPLPDKKQISDLWKSTRELLGFDKIDAGEEMTRVLNSLSGLATGLGGLRNILGDAHGKGKYPPQTSANIAELAINVSSSMATAIVRRFIQVKGESND
jgi:hypothetical protein